MHSDKIYAGFCGSRNETDGKNAQIDHKMTEKRAFFAKKGPFDRKQRLQKRSKTNKTGLDKINKFF